jgi:integration host factor subunit alpha
MGARKTTDRSGITKADLVDAVYERHGGLTKDEAAEIVDKIFQTVKSSLQHGRTVRIKNFGTFEVTDRPGRIGVNPVNGEKIFIQPHKGLSFRPSRRLMAQVKPGARGRES